MADLPSFTVDFSGGLKKIVHALTAAGELTKVPLSGLRIRFTSNIGRNEWLTCDGEIYPSPAPGGMPAVDQATVAVGDDGTLQGSGDPVKLLANAPSRLNVTNVQWTAEALIPGRNMKPIIFDAPADGATVDLSTVVPVPGVTAQGVPVTMAMVDQAITDALLSGGGGGGESGLIFNPATQFWLVSESGSVLTLNGTTNFWEVTV